SRWPSADGYATASPATTPAAKRGLATASSCCSAIRTGHVGAPSRSPLDAPSSTARSPCATAGLSPAGRHRFVARRGAARLGADRGAVRRVRPPDWLARRGVQLALALPGHPNDAPDDDSVRLVSACPAAAAESTPLLLSLHQASLW